LYFINQHLFSGLVVMIGYGRVVSSRVCVRTVDTEQVRWTQERLRFDLACVPQYIACTMSG